jgi:hypothetical protein
MSRFRVLDSGDPCDRARWVRMWEDSPQRPPHAHPVLSEPALKPGERLVAAVLEGDASTATGPAGTVLHVLIVRPVPGPLGVSGRCVDLISPHGYAGPLVWGAQDVPALARVFWAEFDAWAAEAGAVSEFVRLSLLDPVLPSVGTVTPRLTNHVAALPDTAEQLWASFAPKVRQNARRALRSGVTIEIDETGERHREFLRIHDATMDRHDSDDSYRLEADVLTGLHRELPGGFAYVYAMSEGTAVSVDLVLMGTDTAYYHLGGTLTEAFGLRPNDLVKTAAMEHARSTGRTDFVLGGGLQDGDGLERYKRGFAGGRTIDFRTTERILDPAAHARLVADLEARMQREREAGDRPEWVDGPEFFPAYRRRFTVPARLGSEALVRAGVSVTGTAVVGAGGGASGQEPLR